MTKQEKNINSELKLAHSQPTLPLAKEPRVPYGDKVFRRLEEKTIELYRLGEELVAKGKSALGVKLIKLSDTLEVMIDPLVSTKLVLKNHQVDEIEQEFLHTYKYGLELIVEKHVNKEAV